MGWRFANQAEYGCFFVTSTFRNWLPLAGISEFRSAILDSLQFYSKKYDVRIAGYVLMPTHLHLLLFIEGVILPDFMRDFKKFIAQKAAKDCGLESGGLWMPGYDRVAVVTESVLRTKLNYIHHNPVKAGLVDRPEDWMWSSAGDYHSGRPGLVPIWKEWS